MDIEELKKINNLTVQLKKHGIPADDAFKQAESLFKESKEDFSSAAVETNTSNQEYLLEKKFSLMLDMNNKKFQEAIDILSGSINALSQELAIIRNELAEARKAKPVQKEKQEELPKQESHPKQGQFSSSDVSIEKMFYFGKK